MMKRMIFVWAMFLITLPTTASEVFFEAVDEDGATKTGVLTKLDAETAVLGNETIPLERVVRLRNSGEHPYLSEKADRRAASPGRTPTKTDPRSLSSILERKKPEAEDGETVEKTKPYPETVAVVDLVDGSKLVAAKFTLKGKTATGRFLDEKEFSLPVEAVASVRFGVKGFSSVTTPPADWLRLSTPFDKGDKIVVGQPGLLDVYEGVLSEVGEETVSFVVDGETLPVPRRKVFGLVLHAAPNAGQNASETIGTLHLRDGGVVRLTSLALDGEGRLHWTSRQGVDGTSALDEIDAVDFSRSNFVYLAGLQPVRIEYSPLFDRPDKSSPDGLLREFRTKRIRSEIGAGDGEPGGKRQAEDDPVLQVIARRRSNRSGRENALPERPLPGLDGVRLDGVTYENGLSIPARTVLDYSPTEPFTSLRGVVGIDDRSRPEGSVRLLFQADDRLLGEISLRGDEPARKFAFALPDRMATLRITVDFSDGGAGPATAGFGDVRLIK